MSSTVKRALISAAVAAVIYLLGPVVIRYTRSYNIYVEAILLLAAVIGGGCCWIGSR
ncbi:MAG: hypothetical protein HFF17_12670 [Oscillospiraceae bacterium]|nr:hypothetical protein [Oscillospiraceae bacterium]